MTAMDPTKPLPLVGLIEICQAAGVQRPVVSMWRTRHENFPQPVTELSIGPIFWWPSVMAWLKSTGREWNAGWSREQVVGRRGFPGTKDR